MATEADCEAKVSIFQWNIQNVRLCWWLKKGQRIRSPAFVADGLKGTKWCLQFCPIGTPEEKSLGFYLYREEDCSGPDVVDVSFEIALLHKDGSVLTKLTTSSLFKKNYSWGWPTYEERERVFVTERESFLPEDALVVQSAIWTKDKKPEKSNYVFASTLIKVKKRSFVWNIDNPSNLESVIRNKFKDYLIGFDLILNEGVDRLDINMTSFDDSINYICYSVSIIDSEKKRVNFSIKKYLYDDLKKLPLCFMAYLPEILMANKERYFPNNVLSLELEFVLSTIEHSHHRKNATKLENSIVKIEKDPIKVDLIDDFKSLYNDGKFSDMEIRTSKKKFQAHKLILSARSPVFSSMFSNDMKEKNIGQVNITDFEEDTIHRMLLYIYTDSLEDLKFESACKLYKIADKYQILSLKSRCSFFVKENLCPTNACEVLVLAVLYHDDDLKSDVQDYILRHRKQIFCLQEWKDLMSTHLELAAGIMYKKLTNCDMYLH